jgi:hypothetical protein
MVIYVFTAILFHFYFIRKLGAPVGMAMSAAYVQTTIL